MSSLRSLFSFNDGKDQFNEFPQDLVCLVGQLIPFTRETKSFLSQVTMVRRTRRMPPGRLKEYPALRRRKNGGTTSVSLIFSQ